MAYTIDTTPKANVTLVLLNSPQHFSECLIHAMDAYRTATDLANNGESSKAVSNLAYAECKARLAIHLASGMQSKKRGAKKAIIEAEEILVLVDRARFMISEMSA